MQTYAYGYPRLGEGREFKRLIEGYWQGKVSESALRDGIAALERQRLATYAQFVDAFPVGEMTLYDAMLDTAIMLGVYPIDPNDLNAYFELARGENALPMTKWFNTNYHYLVPHLSRATAFRLHWNKPLQTCAGVACDERFPPDCPPDGSLHFCAAQSRLHTR
jgi:5-methyltetrahydropteroyltriglutamate--homocysteine methyltransferase